MLCFISPQWDRPMLPSNLSFVIPPSICEIRCVWVTCVALFQHCVRHEWNSILKKTTQRTVSYLSIYYVYCWVAGPDPSWHWAIKTDNHSHLWVIYSHRLTCMSLDQGRKMKHAEKTYVRTGTTCKLHTEFFLTKLCVNGSLDVWTLTGPLQKVSCSPWWALRPQSPPFMVLHLWSDALMLICSMKCPSCPSQTVQLQLHQSTKALARHSLAN